MKNSLKVMALVASMVGSFADQFGIRGPRFSDSMQAWKMGVSLLANQHNSTNRVSQKKRRIKARRSGKFPKRCKK